MKTPQIWNELQKLLDGEEGKYKGEKTSQKELAEAIGITRQSVSLYCLGEVQPTADKIIKIANYFEVSPDWLLGFSNVPSVDPDIKAFCEYTGLSESALDTIKRYKESCHLNALDLLLSCYPECDLFLNDIEETIKAGIIPQTPKKDLLSLLTAENNSLLLDNGYIVLPAKDAAESMLKNATDVLSTIITLITSEYRKQETGEE